MIKGIDVSENNGYVDFDAVAAAGYKFVIVRCSYGKTGRDEMFLDNVNRAHAAGLLVGAYHYDYSLNPYEALLNAENCRKAIEEAGVLLELPVFYDMEDADHWKANHGFDFSAENINGMCRNFLDTIGLNCGVYASESWFDNYIDWQNLGCSVWNASWLPGYNPDPVRNGTDGIEGYMWQYSEKVVIDGKEFDGDVIYGVD